MGLQNEKDAWTKINLLLGLLSSRLGFDSVSGIRVSENILKITTGNTTFKYEFEDLVVFDATGIQTENEILQARNETYTILDDFELSTLGPKKYELPCITAEGPVAKELHFYSSDRVDGASYITDCVVESELTKEHGTG